MKIIAYTFRTFNKKDQLKNIFDNLFIFGKLRDDLQLFSEEILSLQPDYVIGVASAASSRIESVAVNQFNQNKKIDKNGQNIYPLFVPNNKLFRVSELVTTSFCNWTAYKISKLIVDKELKTQLILIHISDRDLTKLEGILDDR